MGTGSSARRYRANSSALDCQANPKAPIEAQSEAQAFGKESLGGEWQFEESPNSWRAFAPEISARLLATWNCGQLQAVYIADEASWLVDFEVCVQTNQVTGKQQRIGWVSTETGASASSAEDPVVLISGQASLAGEWKVETAAGPWSALGPDINEQIMTAWNSGLSEVVYSQGKDTFMVSFTKCVQSNQVSGEQQRVAWVAGVEQTENPAAISSDAADPVSERVALGGEWQYEASVGEWLAFSADVSAQLLVAWYCGERRLVYAQDSGVSFDVDFEVCVQTNQQTGAQQRIGWVAGDSESQGNKNSGVHLTECEDDVQQLLFAAWAAGETKVRYAARDCEYEVDFGQMVEINLTTGEQRFMVVEALEGETGESGSVENTTVPQSTSVGDAPAFTEPSCTHTSDASATTHHQTPSDAAHSSGDVEDTDSKRQGSKATPKAEPSRTEPSTQCGSEPDPASPSEPVSAYARAQAARAAASQPHYVFKSAPDQQNPTSAQQPRRPSKKFSLAPGKQPTRLAGKAPPESSRARPAYMPKQTDAQPETKRSQPHRGPSSSVPNSAKTDALPQLPDGITYPSDSKAKCVVEALFRDMHCSKAKPLPDRRRAYRAMCLSWHPDKNPKHQALATEVFQFLQLLKSWYIEA